MATAKKKAPVEKTATKKASGPKAPAVVPGTTASDIQIDPRGYRFGAGITLTVAMATLLVGPGLSGNILMIIMLVMFVPGATVGPQATLQAFLYGTLVRPRLSPPAETESFRPPRFAQQMGLGFAIAGAASGLAGFDLGFWIFAGFVLFASFLNSVLDFCLGCEIYLMFKRAVTVKAA